MAENKQHSSETILDYLGTNSNVILVHWEKRVREEVLASAGVESLDLRGGLLDYLIQLAEALRKTPTKTDAAIRKARQKSKLFGETQGALRAELLNYSVDQVIFEYHILREVIFEVLEENGPLEKRERDIIISSVEQAVNDTALLQRSQVVSTKLITENFSAAKILFQCIQGINSL